MAPNFQSSFIPKGPVTEEVFKKKKAGLVGVLVFSLFMFSIIISVAMYVYKGIMKSDIQNLELQLADAEKSIDKKTIGEIALFSKKLSVAKTVVLKHQVISGFLESLASSTVSTVRFSSFSYGSLTEGNLTVNLKGEAANYSSIALQEDVFSKNVYFKSLTFSNLTLAERGFISFDLNISVDPKIALYSP